MLVGIWYMIDSEAAFGLRCVEMLDNGGLLMRFSLISKQSELWKIKIRKTTDDALPNCVKVIPLQKVWLGTQKWIISARGSG